MTMRLRLWVRRIVTAVLLGGAAAAPAAGETWANLRTQIRRNVNDTSSTAALQKYSDDFLLDFANEAQREINNFSWVVQGSTAITLSANTTYYSLPDNFIAEEQVTWKKASTNVTIELKATSERVVKQSMPDYERITAGPLNQYFIRHSTTGANNLEMGLIPAPSSSSTGTVIVDYFSQPADLSGDSDVPFDGYLNLAPYNDLIVYRVTARLKLLELRETEAAAYMALFSNGLQAMRERSASRPNYNPGIIGGTPNR